MFGKKPRPDQPEPEDVFQRMDDESIQVGLLLQGFIGSQAYNALMDLLEKRRLEVGDMALSDDKRPKEYYQGFRAGACALHALIEELVNQAEMVQEKRAHEKESVMGLGLDRGDPVE